MSALVWPAGGRLCELAVLRGLRGVADALEPLEVPRLDPGQVLDVRDGVAAVERLEDRVRAVRRGAFEVLGLKGLVVDRGPIDGGVVLGGAERLQQALLEVPADRHRLARGLHRGAEFEIHVVELVDGPAWHLRHYVVDGGLEGGSGLAGDPLSISGSRLPSATFAVTRAIG